MPSRPNGQQRAANRLRRKKEREAAEAAKKKADLDRTGEVRTTPKKNRRGRTVGTTHQQWNGKKWVTVDKETYEKTKEKPQKTTDKTKQPTTTATEATPPSRPAPKRIPKAGKPEEFGPYRYPQDAIEEGQDFIRFKVFNYKKNRSLITRDQNNLKEKTLGTIILPIPSQINDASSVDYGASGLNFMQEQGLEGVENIITSGGVGAFFNNIGSEVGKVADTAGQNKRLINQFISKSAVNSIGGNITMDQLTARSTGEIINPNMELLFTGPKLRTFKFSFKFTPRFKRESDEVRNIIKAFKRNMKPKGSGGNFLTTPNIFEIRYMEGTQDHKFLNKFKICALTDVSVNYTADGVYATYHDGTPISMTMDLSFSELTPIYNEDYDEYGNDTGVGF